MLVIAGSKKPLEGAIRSIVAEFGEQVTRDLQGIRSVADLSSKVKELKEQVSALEIQKAKKEEEYARREREVEHKVGLERKRSEFEVTSAKREAVLSVREENLAADRKRFEEQIGFHEKRFTQEVGYLKELMTSIMQRLPDVTVSGELTNKKRSRG